MQPLISGFSDSLNIMAFKWRGLKPVTQKIWVTLMFVLSLCFLLGAAFTGSLFRMVMTTPVQGSGEIQTTIILWVNIFLADNASIAAGGVLWALVAATLLIPLVGYSFASVIPEGDLASIKVTDNHKIFDSILLQFVSTISFIQVLVLTSLTSILTLSSPNPGLGIFFAWIIWVISVLLTVLVAWTFEFLLRKYGVISKFVALTGIVLILGALYFAFPDTFMGFFGIGETYTLFVQNLSLNNVPQIFGILGVAAIIILTILYGISFIGSKTLQKAERVKEKNANPVLLAKLGLTTKNWVGTLTQFLANMVLRQSNIWKPLLLSTFFTTSMTVAFFNLYQVLTIVAALIPIMISLVWSVNFFGILGSGTTWLVSLPYGKTKLLSSIAKIQYIIVTMIVIIIMGLITVTYKPNIYVLTEFLLATITVTVVITQFSIKKSVHNPYRYRVHIRGESVLPPNKAFSYMIQLFIIGFFITGISYGASNLTIFFTQTPAYGLTAQLASTIIIIGLTYVNFRKLQNKWLTDTVLMQNIIKTVGQN